MSRNCSDLSSLVTGRYHPLQRPCLCTCHHKHLQCTRRVIELPRLFLLHSVAGVCVSYTLLFLDTIRGNHSTLQRESASPRLRCSILAFVNREQILQQPGKGVKAGQSLRPHHPHHQRAPFLGQLE